MAESAPTRVMCIDDHAVIIEGLRARISADPGMVFVGSLPSLDGIRDEIERLRPDVLLLDVEIPGADVFDAVRKLIGMNPGLRVVVLTAHIKDHYIDTAMSAGVAGYLSKCDDPSAIVEAIRRAGSGEFVCSPDVRTRMRESARTGEVSGSKSRSRLGLLTPRERQILRMIGLGHTRVEIAQVIHRSPKTVDSHRASIMEKLGIHDRVELARYAIREGLVNL